MEGPEVSRFHRTPGIVRVICTDPRHAGEARIVATARWGDDGHLIPLSGVHVYRYEASGNHTWDLTCDCGRNVRIQQYMLLWKAAPLVYATQATRVDVDIMTI
jgi:hypothetical protein